MKTFTKDELIAELQEIRQRGFIANARKGNAGGIGNTLEDLLGIQENNLPIPNASEWELKTQRLGTTSLNTLFHVEPSPTALRLVSSHLLPLYGWKHKQAGTTYSDGEMSFRQTINGVSPTDRGFQVLVDDAKKKIKISFNANHVDKKHETWLRSVESRTGLGELNPQPYWGFNDLEHKAGTKLLNCFFVQALVKREGGNESYHYLKILKLQNFNFQKFLNGLRMGYVLVDFDARTSHNHGTKFRLRQNFYPNLFDTAEDL